MSAVTDKNFNMVIINISHKLKRMMLKEVKKM